MINEAIVDAMHCYSIPFYSINLECQRALSGADDGSSKVLEFAYKTINGVDDVCCLRAGWPAGWWS